MASNLRHYMYIWTYIVREDSVSEFERAYGSAGEWVELFKRGKGYIRTELFKDTQIERRYVTLDYWESEDAHKSFREKFASEFAAIDARCEGLTVEETEIGKFHALDFTEL